MPQIGALMVRILALNEKAIELKYCFNDSFQFHLRIQSKSVRFSIFLSRNHIMTKPTPYSHIGGEQTVRLLVDRFYFYMDTLPQAKGIRDMHQPDLSSANSKLFKFLSGWLGGPNLFMEEYGHPMLRARHFPFSIGESERDQWMLCMNKALADIPMIPELETSIKNALQDLATHMINQEPS